MTRPSDPALHLPCGLLIALASLANGGCIAPDPGPSDHQRPEGKADQASGQCSDFTAPPPPSLCPARVKASLERCMDELLADEEEDGGRRSGGASLEALDSAFQACFERGLVSQAAQVCVSCEEDARACDVGYPSLNHVHAAGEGTFHAWYEESREACRRELLGTSAPSTCPAPLVAAFGRCMDFFDNSSLPDPDWEGLFDFCAAGGHGEMYFSICLHDYQPTPCWAIATDMDRIQTWIDERSELCRAPVLGADS